MEYKEKIPEQKITFEADKDGFVHFGDVATRLLNKQCQYASRYVNGDFGEYPKLGEGLRFQGDSGNYHDMKIHIDDIEEFVRRYKEYQKND
jgi:hypothetical protein